MKGSYILVAVVMLLYLMASFLGSGDIGILYISAKIAQSVSGGKFPFEGVYDAGLALYIIIMIVLFYAGAKEE